MNGFYRFNSLTDFLAVADTAKSDTYDDGRLSWKGGETYQISRERCATGNADNAAKAAAILEQIEASGIIKRGTLGYIQDVAGEFPLVPAFVAGDHECMMRRGETEMQTDRSPLRVYVDICVGADWSADQLISRGVHILALVQLLNERRAVELYWFSSTGTPSGAPCVPIVPIDTQPLDLSTASHVLASAGFFRNCAFAFRYAKARGKGDIPWAFDDMHATARVRAGLGAGPDDLVVHGGVNYSQLKTKPLEWLTEQLQKYAPDMLE